MSAKQYYESIRPDREAWRSEMIPYCMDCGIPQDYAPRRFLEIHEILPRSYLRNNWHSRMNILLLCADCHFRQQARNRDSMIRCLAIKQLRDPLHYDLQAWLKLRNQKAMEFITQAEVNECMKGLDVHPRHRI